MWISDTRGHGHGDKSGDKIGDKSGDNSGEKCVNKRCGGISPTKYAVQYTRTDIHNWPTPSSIQRGTRED